MSAKRLVRIAVFTALITVGGLVSVPVPFTQVELSFQTVFVLTAGLVLGGRDGAIAVLVYIVMGLLGLPVFTKGGGVGYILMPSFGYLIGFPVGAFIAGALCDRGKRHTSGRAYVCALVGMLPVYIIGMSYQTLILHYYTGSTWAAALAGLPAVLVLAVKDGALMGLTAAVYPVLYRAVRYRDSSKKDTSLPLDRYGKGI